MIADLHLHSNLSDGLMGLAEIADLSGRYFTPAGIADHISPYHKIKDEKSFDAYLKALSRFDFLKGGELCLGAPLSISRESLNRLDYIIGSVHALRIDSTLNLFFFDSRVRFPDIGFFTRLYTDHLVRFLNETPMHILGHPLLLPVFLQKQRADDLFTDEQIEQIVSAGVRNQVAFEISGRWQVPGEKFLREVKRQQASIAIGSDAHSPESAFNFDYPLMMMERVGLDQSALFTPQRK
ncbi:MAG: hypothetical protein A2293_04490 [Elusimicrobia bacterium RIFOXYB2_FULL_49_7]|nr:MAG: hypothetical protein A2293_04490 [Elusimicrobia bacterium RIFOXYB2_FULL_49_7]